MDLLTKLEEILLISIYRLKAEAYGARLKRFIHDLTGKDWNYGNLYCTLDQLVKKGYISKSEGDPTPSRGGTAMAGHDRPMGILLQGRGRKACATHSRHPD